MDKKEFEQLVRSTDANKCTCFNWSYTKKSSCMREYISLFGPITPCVMLKGEKCPYYRKEK